MSVKPRHTSPSGESRPARLITDSLEPKTWIIAVTVLMGWHADRLAGVGWGLVAALFSAAVPVLFIKWGEQRGHWGDRHVRRRQDRLVVIPGIMASVTTGIALMVLLDAPNEMIALIVAMLVTLIAILIITLAWKVSVHSAVSAGAIMMLALAYGPWALPAFLLVALVGWSRVKLQDHSLAQVVVGTLLGPAVAGTVFSLLR
ncbi:hypothetical protein ADK70_27130 [Streptomyces rimosus subsp. pseudoverticillatus]|uniref:hypothetical protein n=1 Tax=Streptomyces rimosus TaxID=1927 RepID=UPI0006B2929D|nr:hypothetical protein [Streptomyces rimosus]KOT80923.1 hypothetical protein ADK70_27130 [Streptomyces rimosus subsp. pseudoverticillatus]